MIYFIECGGRIKVGTSRNPKRRFEMLKTGSPFEATFLGVAYGDEAREKEIHILFNADRLVGEWFRKTTRLLRFIRDSAIKSVGVEDGDFAGHEDEMEHTSKITAFRLKKKTKMSLKEFGELFTPPVDKSTVLRWEQGKITPARAIEIEHVTGIKRHELLPAFFGPTAKRVVREGVTE